MLEIKDAKLLSKVRQSWSSTNYMPLRRFFLDMNSGFIHSHIQQIFIELLCQAQF